MSGIFHLLLFKKIINLFILFIYFWLSWVFVAAWGLLFVVGRGLLIAVASLVAEQGL